MGLGPLLIRADADANIGAGHVMRCLALAQAWTDAGGSAWLAARNSNDAIANLLTAEKVRICQLESPCGSDEDARETAALSRELRAEFVVIDGFHFTAHYVAEVRRSGAPVVLVDDHASRDFYDVDVILNPNIFASSDMYSAHAGPVVLSGPRFALLRREFRRSAPRRKSNHSTELLVTLGGSDPDNVTVRILNALDLLPHSLNVTAVSGAANPHLASLQSAADCARHRTRVLLNVGNMAELMAASDLAISAAGITACELAAVGIPMLLITIAENHAHTAEQFQSQGMCRSLGWYNRYDTRSLSDHIAEFLDDSEGRNRALLASSRIDARGAERVVAALLKRELCAHA